MFAYFPEQWKQAKIIPICKPNKDSTVLSSLLNILGKITEKLISSRINSTLEHSQIIGNVQLGFSNRHSTTAQLSRIVDKIQHSFNLNKQTGMIFLDVETREGLRHTFLHLTNAHHLSIVAL